MPTGESLELDFKLDGYPLRFTAEVVYVIPAGEGSGREHPQAGLLFQPIKPALRQSLRHYIESSFIERARVQAGIAEHDASLSWFDLVSNPWAELSR